MLLLCVCSCKQFCLLDICELNVMHVACSKTTAVFGAASARQLDTTEHYVYIAINIVSLLIWSLNFVKNLCYIC
jgi:hypothetical protein